MTDDARIAALEEVPADTTLLFTVRGPDDERTEALLTRLGDGTVVAYLNVCQHWTDVRLDKGEGALVRNGEVVCQKHGATFQLDTGYCDFGPCQGSMLETLRVAVEDGAVLLREDGYRFDRLGGVGRDAADADGSAGGRIDFTGS